MNDRIPHEKQKEVSQEILEVLKKHGLPTPVRIKQAVGALLAEVSCAHQLEGEIK